MYKNYTQNFRTPSGYVTKIMMMMRLTTILLMVSLVQVSAASRAQMVNLVKKNITFSQLFTEIRAQTGYGVIVSTSRINVSQRLDADFRNQKLQDVLDQVFEGKQISFTIEDKTIVVSEQEKSPLEKLYGFFSAIDLSGKVVDENGQPIPGATVRIKGTRIFATTNVEGFFSLNNVSADAILEIHSIGFKTLEIKASRDLGTVSLKISVGELDEVIVSTGYQAISRERMTGSFSTIAGKRLEGKLQPGLLTALEGQVTGLAVTKNGKIEVRGKSTFLANAEPLIVVDGFPISGGLESINIDNVESITVLKDAVAASIYGARSSNGVIVVTTKKALQGKIQVSYKGIAGVSARPDLSYMNKASAADYIDAETELFNLSPASANAAYNYYSYSTEVTALLIAKDRGQITDAALKTELERLGKQDGIKQVQENIFRTRFTQQHNISISGGGEKNLASAAVRYVANQNSMVHSSDKRVIADLKNDWNPAKAVTVRMLANFNFNSAGSTIRTAGDFLNYTSPTYDYPSILQPYTLISNPLTGEAQNIFYVRPEVIKQFSGISGLKGMEYNPLEDLNHEKRSLQNVQARLGASVSVKIIEGLSAEAGGSWTRGNGLSRDLYDNTTFRVRSWYNASTSISNPVKHYIPEGAIIDESRNTNEAYTIRGQVNFNKDFSLRHRFTAIAGGEINKDVLDNNTFPTRYGYDDLAGSFGPFNYSDYNAGLYYNDQLLPDELPVAGVGRYVLRDNRFVSMYANGSYEYDQRFIISGSARIDQTNFFGTNPKYRYKPNWSVGGTYKLSQEKFFQVPWISKLNLRGSYGINGNVSLTQGPYLLTKAEFYTPITGAVSYAITSPPNKDLRWERTKITNLGTDFSVFGNRLTFTADYYHKLSSDLLAPDFIDPTYGVNTLTRNVGSGRNTGLEFSLGADIIQQKDFNWNAAFNMSYNKNKVLKFNYNYVYAASLTASSIAVQNGGTGASPREGYPLDGVFSLPFAGIDNSGMPLYYSSAGKKVAGSAITIADLLYSGTTRPTHVLALTNNIQYKRFDLSFMVISQLGGVLRSDVFSGGNIDNKYVAQRWRKAGDEATTVYPRLGPAGSNISTFPYADVFVESANYLKLRDATLSYTIPQNALKKAGISNLKIQLQGRNLFMIAANNSDIDPETANISDTGNVLRTLPIMAEYYLGLSLNF